MREGINTAFIKKRGQPDGMWKNSAAVNFFAFAAFKFLKDKCWRKGAWDAVRVRKKGPAIISGCTASLSAALYVACGGGLF